MMVKRIFVILWGLMIFSASIATNKQMQQAAADKQMQLTADRQLAAMGIREKAEKMAETEAYAVYGTQGNGFVVVGKYAGQPHVLAYSTTAYRPEAMPCGLRWWLQAVGESVDASAQAPAARKYTAVANFVKTQWGQGIPYNQKCPLHNNQRTPTGCIATAMAQLMRYYEWPAQGQGMGCYTIGDDTDKPVYAAVNGTYDWANLPLVKYSFSTKSAIRSAVSTLMHDCGKASRMNYHTDGSGANDWDQALALARHFQYDSLAMRRCERSLYSDNDWMELINTEMQARRPILYSGSSEADGGHAFLFSGLDSDGRVWVNWGWDGDFDGYYDINVLKPKDSRYTESYDFTEGQSMNIGIQPLSAEGSVGEYRSQWVCYYVSDAIVSRNRRQIQVPFYYFYNVSYLPFVGTVGILVESTDGKGISRLLAVDGMESVAAACYEAYTNVDYSSSEPSYEQVTLPLTGLPAGYYRATWVTQAQQETEPRPIVNEDGSPMTPIYFAKQADGSFAVATEPFVSAIGRLAADSSTPAASYDLQGRPASQSHRGLTIVRQGSRSRVISQ